MAKAASNVVHLGLAPPSHLSSDAKAWWAKLVNQYGIGPDDHAFLLLLAKALEAFDRAERCRRQIDEDGEVVRDRFRQLRPHPALAAERDARAAFFQAMKLLRLDIPLSE